MKMSCKIIIFTSVLSLFIVFIGLLNDPYTKEINGYFDGEPYVIQKKCTNDNIENIFDYRVCYDSYMAIVTNNKKWICNMVIFENYFDNQDLLDDTNIYVQMYNPKSIYGIDEFKICQTKKQISYEKIIKSVLTFILMFVTSVLIFIK